MADEEDVQVEGPLPPWAEVQKRTFTRWLNVHLAKKGLKVENLSEDLQDGLVLVNLLEEISGKKIPKVHKVVKMRIHKTENVAAALDFMRQQGLKLTNIGATDVVDKKTKLILGVMWTIILRYQIQKIEHDGGEPSKSVNAELLEWLNKAIPEYKIRNFDKDWNDGKAISALVNYLKPGTIDVDVIKTGNPKDLATNAIQAAEVNLQIPPILDPADLVVENPDDLSIMTYLSYFRDYDRKHKEADPAETYAAGPGLQGGVIGDENEFTVFPKNSFGDHARPDGDPFHVKVAGPHGDANIKVDLHKNPDGTFLVNYDLPKDLPEGTYNIHVNLKDSPIKGSAYPVEFYNVDPTVLELSKNTTVDLSGLDKETTPDGDKIITITPNGHQLPHGARYDVQIKDPNGEDIHAEVIPQENGSFNAKFYPTHDGKHEINVKLVDQHNKPVRVKGSPFKSNVVAPNYVYPRIVFPTRSNLGDHTHAKIVSSDKQPDSVKHVLSNLPSGWKYSVNIKLVDPSGAEHNIEGSPFFLEVPHKHDHQQKHG